MRRILNCFAVYSLLLLSSGCSRPIVCIWPQHVFSYYLEIDDESLPDGIVIEKRVGQVTNLPEIWIKNTSEIPYLVDFLFYENRLLKQVKKLVSQKAYQYKNDRHDSCYNHRNQFLDTVAWVNDPHDFYYVRRIIGQSSLSEKDWETLPGESVRIELPGFPRAASPRVLDVPDKIAIPSSEPFSIPAFYGGKHYPLKGKIIYVMNPCLREITGNKKKN